MPALRKVAALGEVPRDFEAEAREEAHRKANALKRELDARREPARALAARARLRRGRGPFGKLLASSSSLRVLNPEKSGRLRQNLARAAERAELDAQRALEAEKLRLQKVKGKGSFSELHKKASDFVDPNLCARAPRRARRDGRHLREPRPDWPRDGGVRVDGSERRAGGHEAGGDFDGSWL